MYPKEQIYMSSLTFKIKAIGGLTMYNKAIHGERVDKGSVLWLRVPGTSLFLYIHQKRRKFGFNLGKEQN